MNDITFFSRFVPDILAGRKTITLRDASEAHFKTGDILQAGCYEDDTPFCTIEVTGTATINFEELSEQHACQENMTLAELKRVIADIYPHERHYHLIAFRCLSRID